MEDLNSSMEFDLLNDLETTFDTCKKHDVPLVKHPDSEPFCLVCTKERIAQDEQELIMKALKSEEDKSRRWLTERSVLSDTSIKKATFANFKDSLGEEKRNKKQARLMANDFRQGKFYNVLMSGNAGAGKSHLAMAMLQAVNEFSEEPRKCLFVSVGEIIRKIQDSFSNDESHFRQDRTISMLQEPDVLVLDDLGAESGAIKTNKAASDFINRTLVAVLDGRQEKATIITTNLNSTEISKMYDQRLISRLYRGISKERGLLTFNETTDKRAKLKF